MMTGRKRNSHQGRSLNLYSTHHCEDNQNEENQPKPAAGVVAPSGAVWPRGKRADQEQHKHDEQDSPHLFPPVCAGRSSLKTISGFACNRGGISVRRPTQLSNASNVAQYKNVGEAVPCREVCKDLG